MFEKNIEKFPELKDIETWLKNNNDDFLSSIYKNAQKWELSDRQVEAAKNKWERIQSGQNRDDWVVFNNKRAELWYQIINKYLPAPNYYNSSDFAGQMLSVIQVKGRLTPKQFAPLHKKILRYRKSIIRKIFK